MALDATLTPLVSNDDWFKSHPTALAILGGDNATVASDKKPLYNLQSLLSLVCNYGASRWSYEPGSPTRADEVLAGRQTVTDCKSLADILHSLAEHIDAHLAGEFKLTGLQVRKIEKAGHRIVTTPRLFAFNNRMGSPDLEGRWCFGDHYVVEAGGLCYDPTFKVPSFSFNTPPHLGWYAKETRTSKEALKTKIKTAWEDPLKKNRTVFMKIPSGDYTFNADDRAVKA